MKHQALLDQYENAVSPSNKNQYMAIARAFLTMSDTLNKEAVERYRQHLIDEDYAPGTIELRFRVVRRLYKLAGAAWEYRHGEGPKVGEMDVYTPALSDELIKAMIDAAKAGKVSPLHAAYLALSTAYGIRRIEIGGVRPAHVDLAAKLIYITTAKGGRQRYQLIPDEIIPVLERAKPLFAPCSPISVTKAYYMIERAIGIRHNAETGWHSFRRSIVRGLSATDLTELQIYNFLRWGSGKNDRVINYGSPSAVVGLRQDEESVLAQGKTAHVGDAEVIKRHPFLLMWRDS